MAPWRKIATALCMAMSLMLTCVSLPASASSFSTDNSDLWWNVAESGWGLQLTQRADIIFATLYVYNTNGAATWYCAILNYDNTRKSWTGSLMATSGPWFGKQPFDPASVTVNMVGTMSFTPTSVTDGVLVYSVNGVSVSKEIERATIRFDDDSGDYVGMLSYAAEGCPNPMDRGVFNNRIDFSIVQSDAAMSIVSQQQGTVAVCTSNGSYDQFGQFGNTTQVTGSCSDGSGAHAVTNYYEMNVTPSGITMNFTAPSSNPGSKGCTLNGSIVGIRQ